MARVLVTGANGFIGSHLVKKFTGESHEVFGLVRSSSDLSLIKDLDLSLRYGDVTSMQSMEESLQGIDILIHNAGLASDWGPLESFRKVNLEGTRNAAEAAEKNGIRRIVYMSTTAVYGFGMNRPLKEDDAKKPVFNYSVSKLEAENWLFNFGKQSKTEVTAVRPGNVYGPGDHKFIEKYIDALKTGRIAYVNRGKSYTCPVYAGNLADAVYLAAFSGKAPGEAFNITDGLEITWKQFTEALTEKLGISAPRFSIPFSAGLFLASAAEWIYKLAGSNHPPLITKYRVHNAGSEYHFSIEKAEKVLGFKPAVGLTEAIEKTVSWYQQEHGS